MLDGAILVLCAVGGVQSQSMTVDRQMKRYHIPRLAFINKMDRTGARPFAIIEDVKEKLGVDCCLMQYPMGGGENFAGMIDLITQQAIYFDGNDGEKVRYDAVPAEYAAEVKKYRHHMLETLAMYSDELMELLLAEEEPSVELIHKVTKQAVQQQGFTPVFVGSAYKNKGVQPLLDAIVRYLPSPLEREIKAKKWDDPTQTLPLEPDPTKPFVGMAFKIVEDPFGQLTFMRIYQGKVTKGEMLYNQRTGRKDRFSRIVKMHADKREEIDTAEAGDIVAIMGIDCASGDTYASEHEVLLAGEHVHSQAGHQGLGHARQPGRCRQDEQGPAAVPQGRPDVQRLQRRRDQRDDHRRHGRVAPRYLRRADPPRIQGRAGSRRPEGQLPRIADAQGRVQLQAQEADRRLRPIRPHRRLLRADHGGRRDRKRRSSSRKRSSAAAFRRTSSPRSRRASAPSLGKGPLAEYPVVGLKVVVNDGSYHEVDSSDRAFQTCAENCFREHFKDTKPVLLEPIMKVEIECPEHFQGPITGDLISRRGMIVNTDMRDGITNIIAEVPLAETFGYATDIRSMSQGQGTFTMELASYSKVPASVQEDIIADKKKQLVGAGR